MRALGVLVLLSRVAFAAPNVGVVVAGELTLQNKVRTHAAAWVQLHGYALVTKPLPAEAVKTLANCFVIEDMQCAHGVYEHHTQVDVLVYIRIDLVPSKHDREVALAGYWFQTNRDAVAEKRSCKPCTAAALDQSIDELMAMLLEESGLGKARIKIAAPPGVVAMLDGTNIGLTPVEQTIAAGEHAVELVRDGKQIGTTKITVAANDTLDVVVPIHTEPSPAVASVHATVPAGGERHPSRVLPGLMIAAGLGTIGVGAAYFYLGTRSGPDDPYLYPKANRDAVVATSIGGVVLLTGLVLWWRGTSDGPTAMVSSSGTLVGWVGRF